MLFALTTIAILIVLALAAYAYHLTRKVKQQEQQTAELQRKREAAEKDKKEYLVESLQVISASALKQELSPSEAVIRCKVLLDGMELTEDQWQPYVVLQQVFAQVCEFDTHQARKALPKEERRRQDRAREAIEQQYNEELQLCFKKLTSFTGD